MLKHLDVEVVAKKLAIPTKEWPGNCYAIASAIVKAGIVPKGKARYGHWLGPVADGTMFWGNPIIRHGWAEYTDKDFGTIVVDPTRWVFEGKKPYIYQAPDFDGFYDIGGNKLLEGLMANREAPENDGSGQQYNLPKGKVGESIRHILGGYSSNEVNMDQISYIANQPLNNFCGFAADIYKWIKNNGQQARVPMDNWDYIMEE